MVRRSLRSTSLRKVAVKTPGSRVVTHYRKQKPAKAKCNSCGAVLKGVASLFPRKMQNIPKTAKRPSRPYGGVLCTKCTRLTFKDKSL